MHNIIVGLHPSQPVADLTPIGEALSKLGLWARVMPALWYVKTPASAQTVGSKIKKALPEGSAVFVVDVTSNNTSWAGMHKDVERFFLKHWDR